MKTHTKQKIRNAVTSGLVALTGAVSLSGNAGCSEFNPIFRPSPISSTWKQRGLFDFGRHIEQLYESGEKWTLDDASDTLYVRGENFNEALDAFGLQDTDVYKKLYPQVKLIVKVKRPVRLENGELRYETIATEEGVLSADGSFDTEFGDFENADVTRTNLDQLMTETARRVYGNNELQVVVQEDSHPFSQGPNPFLGLGIVNSSDGAPNVIPLATTPNLQNATMAAPTADSKYVVHIKQVDGDAQLPIENPNRVTRIMVYGPTPNFVTGAYNHINFGDGDMLIGLNNRPLANFDAFVGRVNTTLGGIVNLTNQYTGARANVDFMMHETNYLTSHLAKSARGSKLDRFTNRVNGISGAIDSVQGLGGRLGGTPAGE